MYENNPTPREPDCRDMPTPSDPTSSPGAFEAMALHHLYASTARLLASPDDDLFDELANQVFLDELRVASRCLPDSEPLRQTVLDLGEAWRLAECRDAADLRNRYQSVFGHALSPDYPPYETQYGEGQPFWQSQTLADIAGYYRAFGLKVAASAHERHDHLGVESEFAGFLALKQAHALVEGDPPDAEVSRQARRRFLHDHLAPAMRAFDTLFQKGAEDALYRAMVAVAAAVVAWDCSVLGLAELDSRSLWRPVDIVPASPIEPEEVTP